MGTAFGCLAASSLQPLGVALSAPQVHDHDLGCNCILRLHSASEASRNFGIRASFRHMWVFGPGCRNSDASP